MMFKVIVNEGERNFIHRSIGGIKVLSYVIRLQLFVKILTKKATLCLKGSGKF